MPRDTCRMCDNPTGQQDRDDYRSGKFCSIQCDVRYDHIRDDAMDARASVEVR